MRKTSTTNGMKGGLPAYGDMRSGYLWGKIRAWPPLDVGSEQALTQILWKGTPITLKTFSSLVRFRGVGVPPSAWKLLKSGCLTLVPNSPDENVFLDLTPSGWLRALTVDERIWARPEKLLLREKMPLLFSNWPKISRGSREACLDVLAEAIRFTINSNAGPDWDGFQRNFVLLIFKSMAITEPARRDILSAVANDTCARDYFLHTLEQLLASRQISKDEFETMSVTLQSLEGTGSPQAGTHHTDADSQAIKNQ